MNSRQPSSDNVPAAAPATDAQRGDPPPTPPIEPALEDCCGSGCVPCIFDIYEQERERYQQAMAEWNERQARRPRK